VAKEKIHYEKQRKTLDSFLGHITKKAREAGLLEADIEVRTRKDLEEL